MKKRQPPPNGDASVTVPEEEFEQDTQEELSTGVVVAVAAGSAVAGTGVVSLIWFVIKKKRLGIW